MSAITKQDLIARAAAALPRLRERSPRVQCLTNTVAQPITANLLLALGARVSMAAHPDEVVAMTETADALLVNLGTLDETRVAAIGRLLQSPKVRAMPAVLDPVFVEHSPLRMNLAREVLAFDRLVVKGNASEMRALGIQAGSQSAALVKTGAIDRVEVATNVIEVSNGDPLMAKVTGLGCALGAVIAAMCAVEADPLVATTAALLVVEIAAEHASHRSTGPGTFAAYLLDAVANLEGRDLVSEARIAVLPS
ncbi:MAG TPA: hydroxyethylthiazole kinase [Hyphomicrobiaceae bacterium]|nr:hydroxyethylthiazole kinase [Hyphomicrobiaceae bacterium]